MTVRDDHLARALRLAAGLVALVCAAVVLSGCSLAGGRSRPAVKVLFIGNSFTSFNGGLDRQLAELTPSVDASAITAGGYTLKDHWDAGRAAAAIRDGGYSFVVLQEQSQTPVVGRALFDQYARQFDGVIRAAGARTVLLMTWQRPDSVAFGVTTADLAASCEQVGKELRARVAPAGLAFASSLAARPDIVLNNPDGHPTPAGTYLAACVLYGTLLRRSPIGLPPDPLDAATATRLQQVAATTLGY